MRHFNQVFWVRPEQACNAQKDGKVNRDKILLFALTVVWLHIWQQNVQPQCVHSDWIFLPQKFSFHSQCPDTLDCPNTCIPPLYQLDFSFGKIEFDEKVADAILVKRNMHWPAKLSKGNFFPPSN